MMKLEQSFGDIKSLIDKARYKAFRAIDTELVTLYWNIGAYISERMKSAVWGEKTIDQLAVYLNSFGPDYKGFNRRSLYRMRQFYETYHDSPIVSPLVTQLSWSKNLIILSKAKTPEEREFYIRLSIKEDYTKRELERQIDSAVYERVMLSSKKELPSSTISKEKRDAVRLLSCKQEMVLNPLNSTDLKKAEGIRPSFFTKSQITIIRNKDYPLITMCL